MATNQALPADNLNASSFQGSPVAAGDIPATGIKKTKQKHHSAMLAAACCRSAVNHVAAHSARHLNYGHTGTNVSYEGG